MIDTKDLVVWGITLDNGNTYCTCSEGTDKREEFYDIDFYDCKITRTSFGSVIVSYKNDTVEFYPKCIIEVVY